MATSGGLEPVMDGEMHMLSSEVGAQHMISDDEDSNVYLEQVDSENLTFKDQSFDAYTV